MFYYLFLFFILFTRTEFVHSTAEFSSYEFVSPAHFVSLPEKRERRQIETAENRPISDDSLANSTSAADWWKIPKNVTEKKLSHDYEYYNLTTFDPTKSDRFADYYIDIRQMLKGKARGNTSHPLLSDAYRRAVPAKISFDFPFYGHAMKNLTIATGGFCYIGDQTHSWLAATQYIAPLMANFATNLEGSNVMYADNGTVFVVEWNKVVLKEDENGQKSGQKSPFTFQVSLHKNGNIWFVYKEVPFSVNEISSTYHPRKLGISDAYLFEHNIIGGAVQGVSKRVIYEYHRVEVEPTNVRSHTVVVLTANPTCIQLKSCEECHNATLQHFNCSWCEAKDESGGPFCSDDAGLHRRRQEWLQSSCKQQMRNVYCSADEGKETKTKPTDTPSVPSESGSDPPRVVPLDPQGKHFGIDARKGKIADVNGSSGSGGLTAILILCTTLAIFIAWIGYAYYNPHTSSGQLLIRYRPSRWHLPNSDVRYTASVHM